MRVGLATLKRNSYGHLSQRAAGQRISARQRLRAQQHVNAKGPALPDDAIEQYSRVL